MILSLNIPASNGNNPATLVIDLDDRSHKIKAIKEVRALAGVGLKEAKDAIDKFLSFPNGEAAEALVCYILDNRRNPVQVQDDAEVRTLREALYKEQDKTEMLTRTISDMRVTISDLSNQVVEGRKSEVVREAQDQGFPVMYHGSKDSAHGFYTAFYDLDADDGTYRLVHPQHHDACLRGVGWFSFTALVGCEVDRDEF